MVGGRYQPLPQGGQHDSEKPPSKHRTRIQNCPLYALLLLLLCSVGLNIFQFLGRRAFYEAPENTSKTPFGTQKLLTFAS
jgi:hypothetical protein